MDEEIYLSLKAEIDEECRRKHEALDMVWEMISKRAVRSSQPSVTAPPASVPSESAPPLPPSSSSNNGSSPVSITDEVKKIVLGFGFDAHITQPLVYERFKQALPEIEASREQPQLAAQIAGALRRLEKKTLIKTVRESSGRNPTLYRRVRPPEGE
jgi:hypothetical protein